MEANLVILALALWVFLQYLRIRRLEEEVARLQSYEELDKGLREAAATALEAR